MDVPANPLRTDAFQNAAVWISDMGAGGKRPAGTGKDLKIRKYGAKRG